MLAVLVPELDVSRTVVSWNTRRRQPVRSLELAPGIWICRTAVWQHSSVFDTHSELPLHVELPDRDERQLPYPEWHQWALCTGMPVSAFFGAATDERPTMKRSELAAARRVCAACEVKTECLQWALNPATLEKHGVWGGTSGRQRAEMRKALAAGAHVNAVIVKWFTRWLGP